LKLFIENLHTKTTSMNKSNCCTLCCAQYTLFGLISRLKKCKQESAAFNVIHVKFVRIYYFTIVF